MCWPQGFVEHIFQMEKISEPLTGIEPMTLHTLVRCSNHWATKDIVARSSVVRTSDQCTEDHRFNISWGLRYMYFLCLMLVTYLHHFQYSSYFLSEAKFVCFRSQTHGSMSCLFKIVSRANPCTKPHYWSLLADTYMSYACTLENPAYCGKSASLKPTEISR